MPPATPDPVRIHGEDWNRLSANGMAGFSVAFADNGIEWPTDSWILVPIDGQMVVTPSVILDGFTVSGTFDTRVNPPEFALAWVLRGEFLTDDIDDTGVEGVVGYRKIIFAFDHDEAIALARIDALEAAQDLVPPGA